MTQASRLLELLVFTPNTAEFSNLEHFDHRLEFVQFLAFMKEDSGNRIQFLGECKRILRRDPDTKFSDTVHRESCNRRLQGVQPGTEGSAFRIYTTVRPVSAGLEDRPLHFEAL